MVIGLLCMESVASERQPRSTAGGTAANLHVQHIIISYSGRVPEYDTLQTEPPWCGAARLGQHYQYSQPRSTPAGGYVTLIACTLLIFF